jgi:hypothetical protein
LHVANGGAVISPTDVVSMFESFQSGGTGRGRTATRVGTRSVDRPTDRRRAPRAPAKRPLRRSEAGPCASNCPDRSARPLSRWTRPTADPRERRCRPPDRRRVPSGRTLTPALRPLRAAGTVPR